MKENSCLIPHIRKAMEDGYINGLENYLINDVEESYNEDKTKLLKALEMAEENIEECKL